MNKRKTKERKTKKERTDEGRKWMNEWNEWNEWMNERKNELNKQVHNLQTRSRFMISCRITDTELCENS